MLDDFEDLAGWSAVCAPGARASIAHDTGHSGMGLRLDFDFRGGGTYVIVRKSFALRLPAQYAFSFFLRGEAPRNRFEFKLIDPRGENVWWYRWSDFSFPKEWRRIAVKDYHLELAWGKTGGATPREVAAIELAISLGTGGQGSVWIDELDWEPRRPPAEQVSTPLVQASSTMVAHDPAGILDPDPATSWKSGPSPELQWLLIDFLGKREYGALVIDWDSEDFALSYRVLVSSDNEPWRVVYEEPAGHGGTGYIRIPDTESRYLKIELARSSRGQGYGIHRISIIPAELVASPNRYFRMVAEDARRGLYPKYFHGEQSYWTVVGTGEDTRQALLNAEGMLEIDRGGFSVEPFIYANGRLITWNGADILQELEQQYLPIPCVIWHPDRLQLGITAFASGCPGKSILYLRYRIRNTGSERQPASLFLAVRPFQVNPPWQSVNLTGGYALIRDLRLHGRTVLVNGDRAIVALTTPTGFGALRFDQGSVTDHLLQGRVPPQVSIADPVGCASGALHFDLCLSPGEAKDIYLAVPLHGGEGAGDPAGSVLQEFWDRQFAQAKDCWGAKLNRVSIQLPSAYHAITDTLRTALAHILINRDGPALQPGPRCYARSWIRDGAVASAALLALGCTQEVRAFLEWFARFQSPDGAIPCCVDRHGVDPVVEHDSHGEFIYAVMEYYRHTRDSDFLASMWPQVIKTAEHIDSLRRQRMSEIYKTEDKRHFYGLLPESVSHEGYSGHPVHSYWDNFWALRGLKDAANMAVALGDAEHAGRFAGIRDEFSQHLHDSIALTLERHHIGYLPGSADLGDLDPSASAIALDPCDEQHALPEAALLHTFTDYHARVVKRLRGELLWDECSPYELRNVGALVRLGRREEALEVLDFFMQQRRPYAWNQWAEILWRDPKTPRFIGDMPHAWVGADFIRAVRSLFAFEGETDRALILGAGLARAWVEEGVGVTGLPTHYGTLGYRLESLGPKALRWSLRMSFTDPPAKIILAPPLTGPLRAATVNARAVDTFDASTVSLDPVPSAVVLLHT